MTNINVRWIDTSNKSIKDASKLVDRYRAPVTEATSVFPYIAQPPPKPIEPESWWKSHWLNPKRKKDIYDLSSIRQYDLIG